MLNGCCSIVLQEVVEYAIHCTLALSLFLSYAPDDDDGGQDLSRGMCLYLHL